MNRVNLFLLLFLSSVAFAQEEWVIEEFTPHKGNVFLSTSGTAAVGHRLLIEFRPTVKQCDYPVISFYVSTASLYKHRKALGDEAFDAWLEEKFKGSEVGISLQVDDYQIKETPFRIRHVFNPVADTIGHPVFRTDIVELVHPDIPLSLVARSGEVVTLTISEGSPHYAYFDMPIEIFPVVGLHKSIRKAHDLCKRRLGAEREPIQLLLVFSRPWRLALANI